MATALPPPGDPNVLYVVDLTGYVFRAYHALPPMSTSSGEPTHAVYGVTNMLLKIVNEQRPELLAVALDAPNANSFRKQIYPEYKATRKEHPPDLRPQIQRLEEVVEAYAIPCLSVEGFEADDLIATLVAQAKEKGLRAVVVSADKDLLQLVDGDRVLMFDTMKDKVYGPKETIEKLGVPPEKVRHFLALTGDTSDNVPGVPSVGPKTAVQLLTDRADLDDVYAHIEDVTKKALKAKLIAHEKDARLSLELVSLRTDAPVELDLEKLKYGGADNDRLRKLFTKLEFHRLLPKLAPPKPSKAATHRVVGTEAQLAEVIDKIRTANMVALYTAAEGDDPLAPIAGVALAWEEGTSVYVPTGHLYAGAPPQLAPSRVASLLAPVFSSVPVFVSDLKRELALWLRHGVDLSSARFDAMLASYLVDPERHGHSLEEVSHSELGRPLETYDVLTEKKRGQQKALGDVTVEKLSAFAGDRAHVVLAAEKRLAPRIEEEGLHGLLYDMELPLARVLARMEREGIRVDAKYLEDLSAEYATKIAALEHKAYELAGGEFKINSPRALETVLFDTLKLPVIKRIKSGRSTDADVLEELTEHHELPKIILEHRSLTKLKGTYLDALPRVVHPATGRIHTRFNQAVAATGRMSSSEPNLQNIPIRTEDGRAIRNAFIPRDGFSLMSADYSQIELRVLAHLSHDPELVEAFTRDEDVHVRTAKAIFGVSDAEVTRDMRGQSKTVNYAVIYGQTQFALARNLGISKTEAKRYIDAFFQRYAGVAKFMTETVEKATREGGVRTLLGRWRQLPDITSMNRGLRAAAERVARNTPLQGTAADIMKIAMVRVDEAIREQGLKSRMILTVHDELVFEVAPGEEDTMKALAKDRMEHAMELDVPLVVDVGIGKTWRDAH
jgi:DNA polymerase-1